MVRASRGCLRTLFCACLMLISSVVFAAFPSQAPITIHAPILIAGDADFTAANGVTQGNGTEADPYIIEGWTINASASNGIQISDTDAYFVIRNVGVNDGTWYHYGIYLRGTTHGKISMVSVSNAYFGVRLERANNTVVEGLTVTYCLVGLQLVFSDSCLLSGNVVERNNAGIEIFDSENATLYSNTFIDDGIAIRGFSDPYEPVFLTHTIPDNNTVNGLPVKCYMSQSGLNLSGSGAGELILLNCTDVLLSGVRIDNTSDAVVLYECENVTIVDCVIDSCGYSVSCGYCVNVTAVNNTITRGWNVGLGFSQCTNVLAEGNYVSWVTTGISMWNSWNCTISSNVVQDCVRGMEINSEDVNATGNQLTRCSFDVYIGYGANTTISPDNTVDGKPVLCYSEMNGVVVDSGPVGQVMIFHCTNVRVADIEISGVYVGIDIEWSTNVTVMNTTVTDCEIGLEISECVHSMVLDNQLILNEGYGSLIQWTDIFTISGNHFLGNDVGLSIWQDTEGVIFDNTFDYNDVQARQQMSGNITWDLGYPFGGNYWSDYSGADLYKGPLQDILGPDGIGDAPYLIATGVEDRYPRMPDYQAPSADAGDDIDAPQGQTVCLNGSASHDDCVIVNYTWTFKYDGTNMTLYGPEPEFTFLMPGEYNVTLVVFDTANRTATDTMMVRVTALVPEFSGWFIGMLAGMSAVIGLAVKRRRARN